MKKINKLPKRQLFFAVLVIAFVGIFFASCPTEGTNPDNDTMPESLTIAIAKAQSLLDETKIAGDLDGFWDFSPVIFAPQEAINTFRDAIEIARAADIKKAAETIAELEQAQFLFMGLRYTYSGRDVDKTALLVAIGVAEKLLNDTFVSEDGGGLGPGNLYVSPADYNLFKQVITAAIVTYTNPSATGTAVLNRIADLSAAQDVFLGAMDEIPGGDVDTSLLETAITSAELLYSSILTSTGAAGLNVGDQWTLQIIKDTFQAAIDTARDELVDPNLTNLKVRSVIIDLEIARGLFVNQINIVTNLDGSVAIIGEVLAGVSLTVNTGSLGGSGAISYEWKKGNTSGAVNEVIGSNADYTIANADIDAYITVTVSRMNNLGSVLSNPVGPIEGSWTVTFMNRGSVYLTTVVKKGTPVTKPADPIGGGPGEGLRGWFTDDETFENEYDFNANVTGDLTLYADFMAGTYQWTTNNNAIITSVNQATTVRLSLGSVTGNSGAHSIFVASNSVGRFDISANIMRNANNPNKRPAYLAIDLGEVRPINKVVINFNGGNPRQRYSNWYWAVTSDPDKWTALGANRGTDTAAVNTIPLLSTIIGPDTGWTTIVSGSGVVPANANTWRPSSSAATPAWTPFVRGRYVIFIGTPRLDTEGAPDGSIQFEHMEVAFE